MLNLNLDLPTTEKYKAVLLDLNGEKINEFNIEESTNAFTTASLPDSIYILQIFKNNGDMHTFKLVNN